ncbi:MAG: histidine triad nucleotide-binding protein [Methylococcales bacterium]|jgi:histidine triad (HIT) family protein|nr:histidine triad nucleotide-binding protein [Methylococcales bacterium]MBT7408446.1 histidine triad nucleotide-binding protein [Methylococcales bacterium]
MSNCLFCKIINGDIPADIVYQDDELLAFRDVSPQAPTHVLIIPKKHISTINDIEQNDAELIGKMMLTAKKIANDEGVSDEGYRVVMNCNALAGQTVFHIHLHLMAGRAMTWPPG